MTCRRHGPTCPNVERWMRAERKAGELRVEADAAKAEVRRLAGKLARVGVRDAEDYVPPDTRARCWVTTAAGSCGMPAQPSGLCAAHEAEAVGL